MPWLDPLWQQSCLDALKAMLDVDARTKRSMIEFLLEEGFWSRDKLDYDSAVARFNSCMNPRKPEFFKTSELWALAKRFDRPELILAMVEDLGYERPRRRPTEERRQLLLERIADGVARLDTTLAAARAELARIDAAAPAPRIDPLLREGGVAAFARPDEQSGSGGVF